MSPEWGGLPSSNLHAILRERHFCHRRARAFVGHEPERLPTHGFHAFSNKFFIVAGARCLHGLGNGARALDSVFQPTLGSP